MPKPYCKNSPHLLLAALAIGGCADVAELDDERSTTPMECIGIEGLRSHVGDAVARAIAGSSVSAESSCVYLPDNWLIQVEAPDGLGASYCRFADEPPGVPWAPDTISVGAVQSRVAEMIKNTQREFSYGRLDETDATWDLYGQAIGELNGRLLAREVGLAPSTYLDALKRTPVYLRFELYSPQEPSPVMNRLTAWLPADRSQWRVAIAIQTRHFPFAWSHAKLAIRDGQDAMSSGIECEDLHDLGLQLGQGPARDAQRFFDDLWGSGVADHCMVASAFPERFPPGACINKPRMELEGIRPEPAMAVANQRVTAFSLARNTSALFDELSADDAALAALGAATSSIKLSQDALQFTYPTGGQIYSRSLMRVLADRLRAGVRIDVLSHHGPIDGNLLYAQIDQLLAAAGADGATRQAASCRLRVARHPSHAKFYMVDDRAFYIGSQNLYPSGISGSTGPTIQLDEHGFLIDTAPDSGSELADRVLNSFWLPHWTAAQQNGQLMANPLYACP